jgi:hypothetical protein
LFDVANVGVRAKMADEGYGIALVFGGHQNRRAVESLLASNAGYGYQVLVHCVLLLDVEYGAGVGAAPVAQALMARRVR